MSRSVISTDNGRVIADHERRWIILRVLAVGPCEPVPVAVCGHCAAALPKHGDAGLVLGDGSCLVGVSGQRVIEIVFYPSSRDVLRSKMMTVPSGSPCLPVVPCGVCMA